MGKMMMVVRPSGPRKSTAVRRLRDLLYWLVLLSRQAVNRNLTYITFCPPLFSTQIFFKKSGRSFHRAKLRDEIDFITFQQVFGSSEYGFQRLARSNEIEELYGTILATGKRPLIVDCGANIGLASLHFGIEWPATAIIAVEPDEGNLAQARENLAELGVEFVHAAVGSRPGMAQIFDPGIGNNALRVDFQQDGNIPVVTIPQLIDKYSPSQFSPFIVKIDIEGSEEELFSDNFRWIDETPVLIIELHDWMHIGSANSRNFLKAIANSGRDFVHLNETIFCLRNPLV